MNKKGKVKKMKSCFFEKINKIDKPVARFIKKKKIREKIQIHKIRHWKQVTVHNAGKRKKKKRSGLLWWLNGKDSACECRRNRFSPSSKKIPRAMEQLSLFTRTIEPVLYSWETQLLKPLNYWSPCALEPVFHNKRSQHNEKLKHCK